VHLWPSVVGHDVLTGTNTSLMTRFRQLGGDIGLAMEELAFLMLPEYGGAPPELHGSKKGDYNLKITMGKRALQILLQRRTSCFGALFRALIEWSRVRLLGTPAFYARAHLLGLDPTSAHLNVVHTKVNIYIS
jgi:hypothetical protein